MHSFCSLFLSTVKPAKSNNDAKKAQCNVNNYFYAGPNTKKIEQQLAEIREEIKALKGNQPGGSGSKKKGLSLYFLKEIVTFFCKTASFLLATFSLRMSEIR